jgi:Phage integrase family
MSTQRTEPESPPLLRQANEPRRPLNEAREDGYDIAAVQKLLGHRDVRSTMIYAHAPEPGVSARGKPDRRRDRAGGSGRAQGAGTRPRGVTAYRAGRLVDADRTSSGERELACVRGCSGDAA